VISGIVLAAGTSSRFGRTKQLIEIEGKPLVQHAVDAAAELDEVIVVVGHDAERVTHAVHNARIVTNPNYEEGQSSSLVTGLRSADPRCAAAVVLLADQPNITASHVRALTDAFAASGSPIVRLRFRNGPGPALLAREVWSLVETLTGDTGARALIAGHPDLTQEVILDEDAPADVDTPDDLRAIDS
jgi:molybdenum cofactor cytidylyltransferase